MSFLTSGTLLLLTGLTTLLPAASINYNPAATTDTGWSTCANLAGLHCRTTAYFDAMTLSDQNDTSLSALFQSAFTAWNATGGGQGWTLNFGGDLNGTYDVTTATALQFAAAGVVANANVVSGGLEIEVSVANVTAPALGANEDLVWIQGLYDNYLLDGSIVTSFYEMDVSTDPCGGVTGITCPPAYPFQYGDKKFYDRPRASYVAGNTQAFFDANAYFAVRNTTTSTITVYDGISYGFQNYVSPEPGTWVLLCSGLGLILVKARRRRQEVL